MLEQCLLATQEQDVNIVRQRMSDLCSGTAKLLLGVVPRGVELARSAYGALTEPHAVEAVMARVCAVATAGQGHDAQRNHCAFMRSVGSFPDLVTRPSPPRTEPALTAGHIAMAPTRQ